MHSTHKKLRDTVVPLLHPYVDRITLFGSSARLDMGRDSDVDLLVRLRSPENRPVLGLGWFALEAKLSEKMGRRVDLVTEQALNDRLLPFIEADRVLLYEEG